jgi:glycosyltransferase involved in cell wall biosynthesis/4-amino-4-deoxy-L-arabinose transferase-like glycosyltransferase
MSEKQSSCPDCTVSIIIPVYNEADTVGKLLSLVALAPLPARREIIIVDDGSTDDSPEVIRKWIETHPIADGPEPVVISKANGGKGSAVRAGIACSTGDAVIIQDADLEYDPNDIAACVRPILERKCGIVYGSRERNRENRGHSSLMFYFGGLVVTHWMNFLYGASLSDEPTCYKAFMGDLIRKLEFKGNGFDWEPEVTGKLLRLGYAITEVPISYHPRKIEAGKKISWRDGVSALFTALLWRIKPLNRKNTRDLPDSLRKPLDRVGAHAGTVLLLVGLAFLLRLAVAIPALSDPQAQLMYPDSAGYIEPAQALVVDGAYNTAPGSEIAATSRPPGYSVLLAGLFRLWGENHLLNVSVFCLLSALMVVPIFCVGLHWGGRGTGILAALLMSLNITSIAAAPLYLSDTLFSLCVAFQFCFFVRAMWTGKRGDRWVAMLLAGLAVLIRPIGLLWLFPAVVMIVMLSREMFLQQIMRVVLAIVIFALPVGSWMLRNKSVGGGLRVGTNIGSTLLYHNCAATESMRTGKPAPELRSRWQRQAAEEFKKFPAKYPDVDSRTSYLTARASEIIRLHPVSFLKGFVNPMILAPDVPSFLQLLGVTRGEKGTHDILKRQGLLAAAKYYFEDKLWVLLPLVPLVLVVLLTYGACLLLLLNSLRVKEWRIMLLLLGFAGYYLLLPGPIVALRYQLPALPIICVLAARALVLLRSNLKAGRGFKSLIFLVSIDIEKGRLF